MSTMMERLAGLVTGLVAVIAVALLAVPEAVAQGAAFTTTPGGAQYLDQREGTGPAAALGDVAEIHVVVWLDDNGARGRRVVSTRDQGSAVSFVIGTDKVMEGWNEGIIGMRPGGRRLIMVPPELGFGDRAVEDEIPARSYLIMIVELVGLEKAE